MARDAARQVLQEALSRWMEKKELLRQHQIKEDAKANADTKERIRRVQNIIAKYKDKTEAKAETPQEPGSQTPGQPGVA